MALSIPQYAQEIYDELSDLSYDGTSMMEFCTAVATGVINTTLNLQGTITSPTGANGTGTGIMFSDANISSIISSTALMSWPGGIALQDFCDAIGKATQTHFLQASLSSPGAGTAAFPSFTGAINTMATAIQNANSFTGVEWPTWCVAISTGICTEIGNNGTATLSGSGGPTSGSVTIT